ncbi:MAG: hypothetical protein JNG86_12150 [Verrucomicrobiaceae bacterium]|nr:hypothetical protein [Verrucomicrobiaceae bacterium]
MRSYTIRRLLCCSFFAVLLPVSWSMAGDDDKATAAAALLMPPQEKDGYEFRAEAWLNDLEPKTGRAVRVQMFKGNEYAFCVAVPRDSGVHVTAAVLDFDGKPGGEILPVQAGWGVVLFYKPKKTGTYVVAIRQTEGGKSKEVPCAMITGWK